MKKQEGETMSKEKIEEAKIVCEEKCEHEELKVSKEVCVQIASRQQALQSANILVQMAKREYDLYINERLRELDLPLDGKYNIDIKTGAVQELKTEAVRKKKE